MDSTQLFAVMEAAQRTIRNADTCTCKLAELMAGRLRSAAVDGSTLAVLKRELRDFNIHTGKWKD